MRGFRGGTGGPNPLPLRFVRVGVLCGCLMGRRGVQRWFYLIIIIFSAPEPKALSVVRPSAVVNFSRFDFSSETTEWNSTKFDRKRPLPSFCFWLIGKTSWPPWPLIDRDIFDFYSETAEWNSTKLDRKQDLNLLYQVYVFRADRKNKMAVLASD